MKRFCVVLVVSMLLATVYGVTLAAEKAEVTFLLQATGARARAYEAMVDRYNQQHPDVEVKLLPSNTIKEQLTVLVLGGTPPDIFGMQANYCFAVYDAGWAEPLDRYIKRDGFDTKNLPPITHTYYYKGHWYGMPYNATGFMLHAILYNRDQFHQAGLSMPSSVPEDPQQGWTWEEFRQAARRLTVDTNGDGVPEQYGADFAAGQLPIWAWSNGGDYFNEDNTQSRIDRPEFYDALQWWADLRNVDGVLPKGQAPKFENQETAMSSAMYVRTGDLMSQGLAFDWGLAEYPRGRAGTINRAAPNPLAISSQSKYKDQAWDFVKYWLSDEVQRYLVIETRSIPPQTRSLLKRYPKDLLYSAVAPYDYTPFFFGESRMLPSWIPDFDDGIYPFITSAASRVWDGLETAKSAMTAAAEQVNAKLAGRR